MASSDLAILLGLGIVGIGGYFLFKDQIEDFLESGFDDGYRPTRREEPPIVYEDRFPDYVIEDRYPDVVVEDRYPDYIPYPYPVYQPLPPPAVITCPHDRYWDGERCRRIDCPSGTEWRDGKCRGKCSRGERYSESRHKCVSRCDSDEFWDGDKCRKNYQLHCESGKYWDGSRCRTIRSESDIDRANRRRRERREDIKDAFNPVSLTTRDKWHIDRNIEEAVKPKEKPSEEKRQEAIVEKAITSFLELEYL